MAKKKIPCCWFFFVFLIVINLQDGCKNSVQTSYTPFAQMPRLWIFCHTSSIILSPQQERITLFPLDTSRGTSFSWFGQDCPSFKVKSGNVTRPTAFPANPNSRIVDGQQQRLTLPGYWMLHLPLEKEYGKGKEDGTGSVIVNQTAWRLSQGLRGTGVLNFMSRKKFTKEMAPDVAISWE